MWHMNCKLRASAFKFVGSCLEQLLVSDNIEQRRVVALMIECIISALLAFQVA